ncbi:MAG: hypothetical protein KDA69_17415 [Planctomycetaceae bacterium]|nr:hypothetical protein [Planctomycetaceae bacterium]MCA9046111.1 hypothetical protein [Planctomycetaceae bacterium]MCB9953856.1 hypothetical protein [Planctomycetaceae bacterium]
MTSPQPGDILACYGSDLASRFISGVTASAFAPRRLRIGPSHVAIACLWNGSTVWVESTTMCRHPCLIQQGIVRGPQVHRPDERMDDYLSTNGRVDIYRSTRIHQFTDEEQELLSRLLIEDVVGHPRTYDLPAALLSGTRLLQLLQHFRAADLESLFCSELIATVMMRLNRMSHQNPARFHPARLLRTLVSCGTYQYFDPRTK